MLDLNRDLIYKWRYPDKRIEEKELCGPEMAARLIDCPLLSRLKFLLVSRLWSQINLKLNDFQQLVHLEIQFGPTKQVNLNLPELKVLVAHGTTHCALSIDCPKLRLLVYNEPYDENLLNVKHPESIRKLDTNMFGANLARFRNVECLVTDRFEHISNDTLLSLPKLKEFHFTPIFHSTVQSYAVERMKGVLRVFLNDVQILRKSDFKFTFIGFQLTRKSLDQFDFDVQGVNEGIEFLRIEHICKKNFQLIDPDATFHFVHMLDYSRIKTKETREIPMCFFKRFTGVFAAFAMSPVSDENHLLGFLKSLISLRILCITKSELTQEFYDQLPVLVPLLKRITLLDNKDNDSDYNQTSLSFNFISKFFHLSNIEIYPNLSDSSITSLVRSLEKFENYFVTFGFKEDVGKYWIDKTRDRKAIKIFDPSDITLRTAIFESENLEEILNFFILKNRLDL